MNRMPLLIVFGLVGLAGPLHADDVSLAQQATEILKRSCYECHGVRDYGAGLDVLNPNTLFEDRGANTRPYLSKGNAAGSAIWRQIDSGLMPPEDNEFNIPALTASEKATIKQWIDAGAAFPEGNQVFEREFVTRQRLVEIIENDLRSLRSRQQEVLTTRYFTIANLHNNGTVPDEMLMYARAALSKAMNAMSQAATIIPPRIVDADENSVVLAVNLEDYGWSLDDWYLVIKDYPYTLEPRKSAERAAYMAIAGYWGGIQQEPCIRVDWFVAHATRAPLYDILIKHPHTLQELAMQNGVDIEGDFAKQRLLRTGVFASGVSSQNRLMDRHASKYGAFWLSYDFAQTAKSNIAVFPLGPNRPNHPYQEAAFEEAGSEVVYSRPNGLHGYLIVDNKGQRISRAPVSIVADHVTVDGVPEVVNGLSCMACHTEGIRSFQNRLPGAYFVDNPDGEEHLLNLLKTEEEVEARMTEDRDQYLRALVKTVQPFFPGKSLDVDSVRQLTEPCSLIARNYFKDLNPITAAAELGENSPDKLEALGRTLRQRGLSPFTQEGGIIKRQVWHGKLLYYSVFQETAEELLIGKPVLP
ncbi:MAG: hypothetical protein KDA58_01285 [Planctomycetaceae bacterium]|nr:hypothetical protein [Planctomycetaceae bacterium]